MSGAGVIIEAQGLERLQTRLARLARPDWPRLLETIGATVESQTRRRINDEKESPGGEAWAPWSAGYAARRPGGTSLLQSEGGLLDSIQHLVHAGEVEIGTNLVYGAIHQFGGEEVGSTIPARSFLGLSEDNLLELDAVVDDWVDEQLRAP